MLDSHQRLDLENGQEIFLEGTRGSSAYIIQSGGINISRRKNEENHLLATLGKGEIFGEMALIDSSPRMASAEAAMDSTVLVVTKSMFEQKLNNADPLVRAMLKIFAKQIRNQASDA